MNLHMKHLFKSIGAVALAALISGTASSGAQSIYTSGHGDIGVGYDAVTQQFEPHWHLGTGAVVDGNPLASGEEYEPDELMAQTTATRTSPNGLSSIIGVADGTTIYVLGSSTYQPNLGFAVEELDFNDWLTPITLTLTGWTLPGSAEFALYTTNLAGTTVVDRVFSTFNPGATDFANSFEMTPGDHMHFQWGFTAPGVYEFELTWSGTHVSDGFIQTTETFSVNVVPEPSTWALLGAGALGLAAWSRRRRA